MAVSTALTLFFTPLLFVLVDAIAPMRARPIEAD
jgi:hypothetical protein